MINLLIQVDEIRNYNIFITGNFLTTDYINMLSDFTIEILKFSYWFKIH